MYYVYVLENENNELYFGSTNDLKRRLKEHQAKQVFSTKVGTWELIYYEAYKAEEDARRRESRIKDHGETKRQLRGRIEKSRQAKS